MFSNKGIQTIWEEPFPQEIEEPTDSYTEDPTWAPTETESDLQQMEEDTEDSPQLNMEEMEEQYQQLGEDDIEAENPNPRYSIHEV